MQSLHGSGHQPGQIDFDLHGLAGIRVLDAEPSDLAAVRRQLGPIAGAIAGEPDIVIRFVDRLPLSSPVRYLGVDEAGFTGDAFLVLRSKHKARARVQIAFEQIGRGCEIVCERGLPAVPLLIPIINLAVLGKGALPLHASAFVYEGQGVVATGWSKGGKTETLLAFMARGAEYIGDEWVYISADGRRIYGIPEPVRLWDWHLRELPQYRAQIGPAARLRLRVMSAALAFEPALGNGRRARLALVRTFHRLANVLKQQLYVDVDPQRLFGAGFHTHSASFDRLFFVASQEAPTVTVEPVDPCEVARHMVFSLQHERLPFMSYYLMFKFAFPEAANPLIELAEELQRRTLAQVFAGKPAHAVYHPYPVPIPALFDAISAKL